MGPIEVLIDTDTALGTLGSDPEDGLAIVMPSRSPELSVRAVNGVFGNCRLGSVVANTMMLLHELGRPALVEVQHGDHASFGRSLDYWRRAPSNAQVTHRVEVDAFKACFRVRVLVPLSLRAASSTAQSELAGSPPSEQVGSAP
jgi:inosine-uridine nucleoside N-ribohydrolase